jgi:transporter family-2 protein
VTGATGWAALAFAAGAGIPVMASLNAALARHLGGTAAAAFALFTVGLVASGTALAASGTLPGLSAVAKAPPQAFAGGLFVAFYIFGVTYLAPRFGVANTILFVMVAQILTSSLIDHFGALGAIRRPLQPLRMTGLAILLIGLAITQASHAGD